MTSVAYRWQAWGTAADGQTWSVTGETRAFAGRLVDVTETALRDAFDQLTHGRAVYGFPGVGCRGPYTVTRFEIVREG